MSATIRTTNPATGQPLAEYEAWDTVQIEAAVESAHAAARAWALVGGRGEQVRPTAPEPSA